LSKVKILGPSPLTSRLALRVSKAGINVVTCLITIFQVFDNLSHFACVIAFPRVAAVSGMHFSELKTTDNEE
jgi:hypothetical protein